MTTYSRADGEITKQFKVLKEFSASAIKNSGSTDDATDVPKRGVAFKETNNKIFKVDDTVTVKEISTSTVPAKVKRVIVDTDNVTYNAPSADYLEEIPADKPVEEPATENYLWGMSKKTTFIVGGIALVVACCFAYKYFKGKKIIKK